ncbi:hypothetical protein [Candidatus Thioglobus sp.]|uniref:hypothetical protein n=1 Tax=Candidatus Thioglobus sp. TaxID=2026721 RepID=UPI003D13FB36
MATKPSTSIDKVGLDYTKDKTNSKTKVLATLGQGNIQIADMTDANSSTTLTQQRHHQQQRRHLQHQKP